MNRRLLIGILIALLGLVLIVGGIFAATQLISRGFQSSAAPTAEPVATTQILATTHDIAAGSVLSNEDVEMVEIPVALVARNAITDLTRAVGRITTVHLIQGELLMEHHLADPTNISHDVGYIIGDDQVLMAFPAEDLMSNLNVLQRGDVIDIFASLSIEMEVAKLQPGETAVTGQEETETITRIFTFDANQRIQLSAIVADVVMEEEAEVPTGQAQPTPQPSEVKVHAYLLALNAQDALVLKNLIDSDAIFDIVLRSPSSSELFAVSPVTLEYLVEQYQLEIVDR